MSRLTDVLAFESFNLKDIWKKIKKDPERMFLGTADPWSAKLWSSITGKDYEPLVDQMGGAYGGHTISAFGNQTGGVYGRARDAGINTMPGAYMHDLAHVISAIYAGGYGMDQFGGAQAGAQGDTSIFDRAPSQNPGFNPFGQRGGETEQQRRIREQNEQLAEMMRVLIMEAPTKWS